MQVQDNNRKLAQNIKGKDLQLTSLLQENKELKKINRMEKLDEAYELKEKLDEVTSHLNSRDQDYKVQFYIVLYWNLTYYLNKGSIEKTRYNGKKSWINQIRF